MSSNLTKSEDTSTRTASFTDLAPNEVYNFYAMKSRTAEKPFSNGNLCYIIQAVSDASGNLNISYQTGDASDTEVFVTGWNRTDIGKA